jgi:sec-independent protein translocase protein TatC
LRRLLDQSSSGAEPGGDKAEAGGEELRMTLFEHLGELRSRLVRVTISVAVLGFLSLIFARPIFGLLMKPVLEALPPEARSLIYTSGIEELNVLMKVGLYSGIFLTTPVILWQIWGFVSPGLLPEERRFAGPFVLAGTAAFLLGAAFCYFLILPPMFQFLLREGDAAALETRVEAARAREDDVLRALRLGELERAGVLARAGAEVLSSPGDGQLREGSAGSAGGKVEVASRLDALGRLLDSAHQSFGASARPVLRQVLDKRVAAVEAYERGELKQAASLLDEAAALLAGVSGEDGQVFATTWTLQKEVAFGKARHAAEAWTRPMLSMREQLSLVLMLELAFGVIFELPLIIALLAVLGIVRASFLFKYQRHAIVVCLIAAAIITPTGDAVNLALMCVPMFLCYELGLLAAWVIEKRRDKAAATTALAPPA